MRWQTRWYARAVSLTTSMPEPEKTIARFWHWRRRVRMRDIGSRLSEQEKIEARCMVVLWLALDGPVHMMTVTPESAIRHAEFIARIAQRQGVDTARLPVAGAESMIVQAYRSTVLIGPISEFVTNIDRGLHTDGKAALVEGQLPDSARSLLSGYQSVRVS